MKARRLIAIGISLTISLAVSFCSSRIKQSNVAKTTQNATAETQKEEPTADQSETIKYNAYIGMKNKLAESYFTSLSIYISRFGDAEEIKIPKDTNDLKLTAFIPESMEAAFEVASKEPSYGEIDENVKTMNTSYLELVKISQELEEYYAAKSYADDDFAKAKELHPQIINQAALFNESYVKFNTGFAIKIKENKTKEMQYVKDEGLLITYSSLKFFDSIDLLFNEFEAQGITDKNITSLDLAKFKPLYDQLAKDYEELQTQFNDEKMLTFEGLKGEMGRETRVSTFKKASTTLKADIVELIERVEKKDALSKQELQMSETTLATSGSIGSFNKFYDELISAYNFMIS